MSGKKLNCQQRVMRKSSNELDWGDWSADLPCSFAFTTNPPSFREYIYITGVEALRGPIQDGGPLRKIVLGNIAPSQGSRGQD